MFLYAPGYRVESARPLSCPRKGIQNRVFWRGLLQRIFWPPNRFSEGVNGRRCLKFSPAADAAGFKEN